MKQIKSPDKIKKSKKMKYKIITYIVFIILIILLIVNIFLIFYNKPKSNKINLSENLNCSNKDIFTLSYCMEKELEEFYNYNLSNIGKNLNLNQLKESGGVCSHYAEYYRDNFLNIGAEENKQEKSQPIEKTNPKYYISKIVFSIDNETAHAITIVSNAEGYCLLDQLDVNCWRFEDETE